MAKQKEMNLETPEQRLESLEGWKSEIDRAQAAVTRRRNAHATALAQKEEAAGTVKKTKGLLDQAMNDLEKAIRGQKRLPGMQDAGDAPPEGDVRGFPIESLLAKAMKSYVGQELMEKLKAQESPIGVPGGVLAKLHDAGVKTIGDLEDKMESYPKDWFESFSAKPDSKMVLVVQNTYTELRRKYPKG